MDYDLAAEKLRERFEGIRQENRQLRDELAVLSNENYVLKFDRFLAVSEAEENQAQQCRLAELEQKLVQVQQELVFIQSSNTYKIWMKYRRLPEPVRKVFRGIFAPIKMIYKGIKKVFR